MTLAKVTIEPLKDLTNWYKLTFISRKDGIGQTSVELLCSAEALNQFRGEIDKAIGAVPEQPFKNWPKNIQEFMKGDDHA